MHLEGEQSYAAYVAEEDGSPVTPQLQRLLAMGSGTTLPFDAAQRASVQQISVELEDDDASDEAAAGVAPSLAPSLPLVAFFAESRLSFL